MEPLFAALARASVGVDNQSEVYQSIVDVAEEATDPDVSLVVRRHLGDLVQVASRSPPDHDVAPMLPADSVPGTSLSLDQPVLVDDQDVFQSDVPDSVATPLSAYRSLIAHPFGDSDVLVVGAERLGAFDESDAERVAYIATFADAVLECVEEEVPSDDQHEHLEQVAAVLSHDVDNILTVVNGYLALLAEETRSREEIDSIQRGLDRLDQLIDDLVTILRTEDEDLRIEPVDLRRIVGECWELVESEETTLVYGDLATVMADESRLRQILENLLRNAVEHTGADGMVWVGAMVDGSGIYVEDDGPGIPPEKRERVFDYGYSGSGDSTGLGLSIVQWMVEAHGWDVRVTEAELGGARFELTGLELDRTSEFESSGP
jgi:signal transduction histidine kinase